MRKLLIATLILLSSSAMAIGWFPTTMQVYITPMAAQGTAYNNTSYALLQCRGTIFGRNQFGLIGRANFCLNIPRGGMAHAFLNNYGNSYFIQAWANIECRPVWSLNTPCY